MPVMSHRKAGLILAAAAAAALAVALASERYGGLNPCLLCLWQRWPYRIAIGLGVLAALLPARWGRLALIATGLVIAAGGVFAFVHVGVEQGWWPSPLPGCSDPALGGAQSVDDLMARLRPAPAKPCDEAAYLLPFLPVSMATMNLIYAAALGLGTLRFLRRSR